MTSPAGRAHYVGVMLRWLYVLLAVAALFVGATVIVVNMIQATDGWVDTRCMQLQQLAHALRAYEAKEGRLPLTAEGLRVARRYLPNQEVPVDPWGNAIWYQGPKLGDPFTLRTFGRDGAPGGRGWAEDIVYPSEDCPKI